jgi:hypothetical protein
VRIAHEGTRELLEPGAVLQELVDVAVVVRHNAR